MDFFFHSDSVNNGFLEHVEYMCYKYIYYIDTSVLL